MKRRYEKRMRLDNSLQTELTERFRFLLTSGNLSMQVTDPKLFCEGRDSLA
jgi:hypothetical protein